MPIPHSNRRAKAATIADHILHTQLHGVPRTPELLQGAAIVCSELSDDDWMRLLARTAWAGVTASDGSYGASRRTRELVSTVLLERANAARTAEQRSVLRPVGAEIRRAS